MKKIVMIGPVYPYKGGISHYTSLMYRTLLEKYDVEMISFKLQYPKFLYKSEQKDMSNGQFAIANTKYWINTMNPLNILSVAHKINTMKPDLVIIPWWHPYFSICFSMLTSALKKTRIIYVCHNVLPHKRFPLDSYLTKMTLRKANAYILHSKLDENDLRECVKNPVYQVTPHPTYNFFKMQGLSKKESRELISISQDEKVLLFFGFVREYKGLKHLLKAMPEICKELDGVKLLVVGDFGEDRQVYIDLIEEYGIEKSIEVVEGYIPDSEVEKYFVASDLVVLPYESATQSGIVQIAYGFEKPVVVTAVGGLPEVVLDGKTGYVVEPQNPEALAKSVIKYFSEGNREDFIANIRADEYKYSWEQMRSVVEKVYSEVVDSNQIELDYNN